jgi:hypothetical protein
MVAALWMRLPKKSSDLLQLYLTMKATKIGILKRSENLSLCNINLVLRLDTDFFSFLPCGWITKMWLWVHIYRILLKMDSIEAYCWWWAILLICRHPNKLQSLYMMRRCNQLLCYQSKLATCTLRLSMQHLHPLFTTNIAHWWTFWPLSMTNINFISTFCAFWQIFTFENLQSGQRVVLFSYGSGLTATMFSLKLRDAQHPFSLSNIARVMDVAGKLKSRHEVLIYKRSVKYLRTPVRFFRFYIEHNCNKIIRMFLFSAIKKASVLINIWLTSF